MFLGNHHNILAGASGDIPESIGNNIIRDIPRHGKSNHAFNSNIIVFTESFRFNSLVVLGLIGIQRNIADNFIFLIGVDIGD